MELNFLDHLTGVYIDKYLYLQIDQEILRAQRYGRPITFIFFDVQIPDRYRVDMQYRVLKQLGVIVRTVTRNIDIPGRTHHGITVMLPETPIEGARIAAEKIKERLEDYLFVHTDYNEEFHVHLNFSIASYPENGESRADLLLYLAKSAEIKEDNAPSEAKSLDTVKIPPEELEKSNSKE